MSALSDRDIIRERDAGGLNWLSGMPPEKGGAEPWRVQPASVELTLCGEADSLRGYGQSPDAGVIDPECPPKMIHLPWYRIDGRRHFDIQPQEFVLACTEELIEIGPGLLAILDGKSSLGRLGLQIHVSAGYIDPGWAGRVTLELVNHARRPIRLWAGMRIGQIRFERLSSPAERLYGDETLGSHYHGSLGTVQAASVKYRWPVVNEEAFRQETEGSWPWQ